MPHELRHTAASLAVSAGANVKAVQRMLGHAFAAITLDEYVDLFDDDLDAVADRLDAVAAQARSAVAEKAWTEAGRTFADLLRTKPRWRHSETILKNDGAPGIRGPPCWWTILGLNQ